MIVRSDRLPQLTRHLLRALGFGAIAAIALTGACGGNVVVDPTTGSGAASGQGGAGSTYGNGASYNSTTTYGTGTVYSSSTYGNTTFEAVGAGGAFGSSAVGVGGAGEPSCSPMVSPDQYATQVCVPNQDCSQSYSPQLLSVMAQQLGVCDQAKGSCCGDPVVGNVDCGPAYMGNTCCYVVTVDKQLACP